MDSVHMLLDGLTLFQSHHLEEPQLRLGRSVYDRVTGELSPPAAQGGSILEPGPDDARQRWLQHYASLWGSSVLTFAGYRVVCAEDPGFGWAWEPRS